MSKINYTGLKYIFENFDKLILSITTFFFLAGFFCLAIFLHKLGIGMVFDLTFLPVYGAVSVMLSSILAVSLLIPYFIGVSREIIPSFKNGRFYDLSWRYVGCVVIPLFISAFFFYGGISFPLLWVCQFSSQLFYVTILSIRFRGGYPWQSYFHLKEFFVLLSFFMFFSVFITVFFAIDLGYVIEILIDRSKGDVEAFYPYVFYCVIFVIILYLPILVARGGSYNFAVIYFAVMVFFAVMVGFPDFLGQRTLRLIGNGGGIVKKYTVRMEEVGVIPLNAKSMFCDDSVNCNFTIPRRVCLWFSTASDLYISEISGLDARKNFCSSPQGKVFPLGKTFLIEH
ncbi:hypothetical protein [Chromobacterium vaccinii]|uniref:hypothetical protein n=1 Tax=Chromobacterium vaccinii TaxID=1108595 RepID=UPI000B1CD9CB|nr:hypothetical protein [Chromobacterium vaccinii]